MTKDALTRLEIESLNGRLAVLKQQLSKLMVTSVPHGSQWILIQLVDEKNGNVLAMVRMALPPDVASLNHLEGDLRLTTYSSDIVRKGFSMPLQVNFP